jgi:hypothetical protein
MIQAVLAHPETRLRELGDSRRRKVCSLHRARTASWGFGTLPDFHAIPLEGRAASPRDAHLGVIPARQ